MTYADQFPPVEIPAEAPKPDDPGLYKYNQAVLGARRHSMAVLVDMMATGISEASSPGDLLAFMLARAVLEGAIPMRQPTIFGALMGGF